MKLLFKIAQVWLLATDNSCRNINVRDGNNTKLQKCQISQLRALVKIARLLPRVVQLNHANVVALVAVADLAPHIRFTVLRLIGGLVLAHHAGGLDA